MIMKRQKRLSFELFYSSTVNNQEAATKFATEIAKTYTSYMKKKYRIPKASQKDPGLETINPTYIVWYYY